ncbi:LysR family transcriptional regulator [Albidovulum sediminicola]|uniref:LysR family transcriptional regulator n=1 Tax=Albidovulum sediminicola TaxID=2984331 RepID=A0ABT2Z6D7_9RHOB|nr:LysR family transcriptional regulator [Defluviimonas sp. WL0075]MCV2866712.1 LysR family transcriptional regulator [Defluviimonas sp. WL0075]
MLYVTLRQMEYVVAVARAGSMAAAAEALNISQPALSVALSVVEARLEQKLFLRRRGTALRLTPFAIRYVAEVEALLMTARRLEDPSKTEGLANGTLSIGCFTDLAPFFLVPLVKHLRDELPGIDVRWRVGSFNDLAQDMADGRIDLAVTFDLGLHSKFEKTPLLNIAPYAFVSKEHRFSGKASVSLTDLAREPLIVFDDGLSLRHWTQLFRQHDLSPVFAHRVNLLEVMRSLAANGEGIGISYSVPPSATSYDGTPLSAIRIAEATAREPVILARSTNLGARPVVEAGREVITRTMSQALAVDGSRAGEARMAKR